VERVVRGALRSGADLPPQQLTPDAERITSRRLPFLGPFPRGSQPFDAALDLFALRARAALRYPTDGPSTPHQASFRAQTLPRPVSPPRPRGSVPRSERRHLAGHGQGTPTVAGTPGLAVAPPSRPTVRPKYAESTPKVRRKYAADAGRFEARFRAPVPRLGTPSAPSPLPYLALC
jgi:hypothetical protein